MPRTMSVSRSSKAPASPSHTIVAKAPFQSPSKQPKRKFTASVSSSSVVSSKAGGVAAGTGSGASSSATTQARASTAWWPQRVEGQPNVFSRIDTWLAEDDSNGMMRAAVTAASSVNDDEAVEAKEGEEEEEVEEASSVKGEVNVVIAGMCRSREASELLASFWEDEGMERENTGFMTVRPKGYKKAKKAKNKEDDDDISEEEQEEEDEEGDFEDDEDEDDGNGEEEDAWTDEEIQRGRPFLLQLSVPQDGDGDILYDSARVSLARLQRDFAQVLPLLSIGGGVTAEKAHTKGVHFDGSGQQTNWYNEPVTVLQRLFACKGITDNLGVDVLKVVVYYDVADLSEQEQEEQRKIHSECPVSVQRSGQDAGFIIPDLDVFARGREEFTNFDLVRRLDVNDDKARHPQPQQQQQQKKSTGQPKGQDEVKGDGDGEGKQNDHLPLSKKAKTNTSLVK